MNTIYRKVGNIMRNMLLKIKYPHLSHGREFHFQLSSNIFSRVESITCGDYVGIGPHNIFMCNVEFGNYIMTGPEVKFLNKNEHRFDLIGKDLYQSGWGSISRIVVEDDVWIGCSAIILGPCKIGKGSIIAAGSIITKDVSPYSIMGGNPARLIKARFTSTEIVEHERLLIERKNISEKDRSIL